MAKKKDELTLEKKLERAIVPIEEGPYKIPSSWVWTRLGEIVTLENGENIENEELDYFEVKALRGTITPEKKNSGRIVEENDRVILVDGENSGEIFRILYRGYMGSTFKKLCFKDKNMWDYISLFLVKNKEVFKSSKIGSAIPHLNKNLFKTIEFPLPPLNEQKRIVDKLDSMFEKIKRSKGIIEEIKTDIENRKISILDRAFKGKLTEKWRSENEPSDVMELLKAINDEKIKKWEDECNEAEKAGKKKPKKPALTEPVSMLIPLDEQPYDLPDAWVWVRLGEVAELSGGSGFPEEYQGIRNKKIPFYKVKHLKDTDDKGYLDETENYIDEEIVNKIKAKIFHKDSIIFAKIGEAIRLNRRAILSKSSCVDNNIMIMQVNSNFYYRYFYFWTIKEDFYKYTQATTVPSMRQSTLEALSFPLPPLEEQKEIVRLLDEILEKENKAKDLLNLEEQINILEKTILHKAFTGQLGTQDPNDEPAMELLKKILMKN